MKNQQNQMIQRRISTNGNVFGDLIQSAAKALIQDASTWRKRVKPDWARFKATITYTDGNKRTMYSIDACKEYSDNEHTGLTEIKNWVAKCYYSNLIDSIQIFITLDPLKDTKKMSYNKRVLFWTSKFNSIEDFNSCLVPELKFFNDGRVNLERLKDLA